MRAGFPGTLQFIFHHKGVYNGRYYRNHGKRTA